MQRESSKELSNGAESNLAVYYSTLETGNITSMVVHVYNPSTWEVKAGRL
jgi:hypothetical protein